LGTPERDEALRLLPQLDWVQAERLGLAQHSLNMDSPAPSLAIEEGRKLYESHLTRPRVTGGVRTSTAVRYKTIFDKFVPFVISRGVTVWNRVNAELLNEYAAYLEGKGYAYKTLTTELTTIKQAVKWLIQAGHLQGMKPLELKLRKVESERTYCYRPEEVRAIVHRCRNNPALDWLGDAVVALACTGLRFSELASLRWSDIDLSAGRLRLTDETGRSASPGHERRELKSDRGRSFPIHPDLHEVLDRLPRTDAHIFHGPLGRRLKPDTVRTVLVREVLTPLAKSFPKLGDEPGFEDGRLHSFRHYFCSTCANNGVPERMVMEWLGHQNSEMVRIYYHLHDDEARRRMAALDFLGGAGGRSVGEAKQEV
jgi:integrase